MEFSSDEEAADEEDEEKEDGRYADLAENLNVFTLETDRKGGDKRSYRKWWILNAYRAALSSCPDLRFA